ncbi:MAG: CoA transferase [Caulobacteraceae bacterium]
MNLKEPADAEVFRELAAEADVYIQNFRPGAAGRMARTTRRCPRSTRASSTPRSPASARTAPTPTGRATTSVTQALSGFLGVATDPKNPRLLGPAMADAMTGIYAALGILAALVERGRTGEGQLLEISMLEAMMHFAVEPFTGYFALGDIPTALDRPKLAQAFILTCADGRQSGRASVLARQVLGRPGRGPVGPGPGRRPRASTSGRSASTTTRTCWSS